MAIVPNVTRLDEVIQEWARKSPARCAAMFEGREVSYQYLTERAQALASALVNAGIQHGDRVAVLQTPRPEFLVTLFAVSSIGAIWVGLNPKYQIAELLAVCADSRPRLLITRTRALGRDYTQEVSALRSLVESLERVIVFDGDPLLPQTVRLSDFIADTRGSEVVLSRARSRTQAGDPCVLVYTSGSTGRPKGALLSHEGVLAFARLQNDVWPVEPLRTLNYFPINHVGSIVDVSLPCLTSGGTIYFLEAFNASRVIHETERNRLTFIGSVPSAYQLQMRAPGFYRADWSSLQLIVWEGAAMAEESIKVLMRFGCSLATNYGMTEASAITVQDPTRDLALLASTVGVAYPGVSIRLKGEDGSEVTAGEPGEVWVKSRTNFLGYWGQPEATAEALSEDGYFRTGDIAARRYDGRYSVVGRVKDMYKSGGYNVYPREVEAAIEEFPSVSMVAVVSRPDPLWQEVGVAFVVPRPGMNIEGLEQWLETRLANYKRPKQILIEASLPLLPIGKIDRGALKNIALRQTSDLR